jgi:hypothetical protein
MCLVLNPTPLLIVVAAVQTWDLINPDNSIKRDVVMQGPAASSSVKTGNAFAR